LELVIMSVRGRSGIIAGAAEGRRASSSRLASSAAMLAAVNIMTPLDLPLRP
jgi:hypothetical protein